MERVPKRLVSRLTAASLAALLFGMAAPAHAASVDDPNNARGPLDLKRLVANKHDATAPMRVRLVTYGTWPASLLDEDGQSRLNFLFNSDHVGRVDFIGEVFFRDGRLMMRIETRAGQFVRRVRVKHPTGSSITAVIPRGLPNPDGNAWIAATERYQSDTGFCISICKDRIPGKGWLKVTPGL
jgi:hypothetical protein